MAMKRGLDIRMNDFLARKGVKGRFLTYDVPKPHDRILIELVGGRVVEASVAEWQEFESGETQ